MMDSVLKVNIDNIDHNIKYLSDGKKPCLMVKADGYGLGIEIVSKLYERGYNYFGVSNYSEAQKIRHLIPECDILIVTKVPVELFEECVINNFSVAIISFEQLSQVVDGLKYHIKLDTGMNRIGFKDYEYDRVITEINNQKLQPEGIFTHLSCADNENFSQEQIAKFKSVVNKLVNKPKYIHFQNTLGCILYKDEIANMVRPGIGIYGLYASEDDCIKFEDKLKLGFSLEAAVVQSKFSTGAVGYDAIQEYEGFITTLKLGYHDGLMRSLSGYQYPGGYEIVGKICMCQHMITGEFNEDYFPVITCKNDIYNIAKYCGITIYELIVGFSPRIERRYNE